MEDDQEEISNIEDYYDYRQIYLKALLNSVPKESIKEIWKIIPYMSPNSYQYIIILNDGTHLCTCLLLVSHGIICRHYFKLMVENPNALFHIMLMPTRWFRDDVWDRVDSILNEPFIGTSFKGSKQTQNDNINQGVYLVPKHYDNIQKETKIRHYMQKKLDYGRIMGHFKLALNYSLDDHDQENLDNIILAYISEKESKQHNVIQSGILKDNQNLNYELELSDGRIYDVDDVKDPMKRRGKGRPVTKRLKANNEQKNQIAYKENTYEGNENGNNMSKRRCRLCHNMGHYAPKCPSKSSN